METNAELGLASPAIANVEAGAVDRRRAGIRHLRELEPLRRMKIARGRAGELGVRQEPEVDSSIRSS
jgi:hypothetical protein